MYTRGRKKAEAEPTPPARDPRDVEMIERLQQRIQELELQQLQPDSPTEEAETEPNVWDDEPVDLNPFGGRKHRYVNRLYQPRRNDHVVDRNVRYHDDLIRSLGLKIEILEFTGKVHLDDFIDWLSTVERVFDVWDIPDKLKVINKFDKLRMRCDVVKEEEQVFARFLGVLKPEIADIISHQPYWTYMDVCNTRERVDNARHCYKCSGLRHYARDCPNRKTLAFRVLNVAVSKSVDDASWLRNNIFRTKCTSKGKICDMIIDGGSCENVVIMYTPGRKKADAEPTPPTRDPRDIADDRYRRCPIRSLGLKIEIPEFTGKVHLNDFIDWLSTVERVVDVRDIPDKLKVKLVAIKLRQPASIWWDHNMTMEEVINEFDILQMRCDVVEEEEQFYAGFLGVLKPEIADIVSLQPYWTYTDVCKLALKVEKHIKAKSKGSNSRFTSRYTPPTQIRPPTAPK
ncbi:reverse transcriptase domain-containing protein [Tanacetum coccineum]